MTISVTVSIPSSISRPTFSPKSFTVSSINHDPTIPTLHLAHIIEEIEQVPFESKEQFLRDVLLIEVNSRQTTKIARLIKKARFRELKWLKDYEWTEQLHLPATTSKEEICDLRFIKEKQNLLLLGTPGTGKTHLGTALGVKACEMGYEVRFFRVADLVAQLEEALKEGTLNRLKRQIEKCDLLILENWATSLFKSKVLNYCFILSQTVMNIKAL
ncbi:DNA replication protein DnaC [Aeribacillus sp. SP014]